MFVILPKLIVDRILEFECMKMEDSYIRVAVFCLFKVFSIHVYKQVGFFLVKIVDYLL